jgi:hypothetical protein
VEPKIEPHHRAVGLGVPDLGDDLIRCRHRATALGRLIPPEVSKADTGRCDGACPDMAALRPFGPASIARKEVTMNKRQNENAERLKRRPLSPSRAKPHRDLGKGDVPTRLRSHGQISRERQRAWITVETDFLED